jgi:formate hydrogenlyase subunit 6/NADH:ubiquinone oxidoreductase subunit I
MLDMVPNVLKNLITKYSTRNYPVVVREPFENARGELYNEIEKCIMCRACSLKCPSQCITVDPKKGVWECDPFACVYCGICVEVCPVECLHQKQAWRPAVREREQIVMQGTPKKAKPKKKVAKEMDEKESS